jgi:hypothetical protein
MMVQACQWAMFAFKGNTLVVQIARLLLDRCVCVCVCVCVRVCVCCVVVVVVRGGGVVPPPHT